VPELPVPTALHSATRQLTSIPPLLEPCPASTPAGFGNPDGRLFSLGYKLHALWSGPSKGAHVVPVERHLPKGQPPSTWASGKLPHHGRWNVIAGLVFTGFGDA